jgi:hypothetical protein
MKNAEMQILRRRNSHSSTGFVNPEIQILLALYAIHFSLWIPAAARLYPAMFLPMLLAPVVFCHGISALYLLIKRAIRGEDNGARGIEGFPPGGHLLLLIFTLASPFITKFLAAPTS